MLAAMPERRSQTLERELLEFAPDAVIGVDEQGEIKLANSRTEAVFGYRRGELVGQQGEMLVPGGLRSAHGAHRDRYFEAPRTRPMGAGLDPKVAYLRFKVEETSEKVLLGKFSGTDLDARETGRALIAPLLFRGQSLGLAVALDHVGDPGHFDDEHQRILEAFAASAATGVATARSMAEERLQNTIDAAEQERGRWARELHDETLQSLAVLRMRLASALRDESPDDLHEIGQEAVQQIDDEIVKLRRLITELRPASLDTIGLEAALYALAQQHQQVGEIQIECDFGLPREAAERPAALLETAVYRLVQEALNNVSKHSIAQRAELRVLESGSQIEIEVSDDGVGFEPNLVREGFGLVGMRERVTLLGGTLRIDSERGSGTTVRAQIPLSPPAEDET